MTIDDNEYLKWLSAYIHNNPKVASLVSNPKDYKWSSCSDYLGFGTGLIQLSKDIILDQFKSSDSYGDFVDESYKSIKDKKDLEYLLLDN